MTVLMSGHAIHGRRPSFRPSKAAVDIMPSDTKRAAFSLPASGKRPGLAASPLSRDASWVSWHRTVVGRSRLNAGSRQLHDERGHLPTHLG